MKNSICGTIRVMSPLRLAAFIIVSLMLSACGGPKTLLNQSPQFTGLLVSPRIEGIALGQTIQFTAIGRFSDGSTKDETASVVWSSGNGNVASISASGLATSLSVGSATMSARAGGLSNSATLNVGKAVLVAITIRPSAPSIALGTATQLTATGTYTDRSTQNITTSVEWGSSQPNIAIVSSAGLSVSRSIGTASITATSGSVNASCQLNVLQAALVSISVGQDRSTVPLGATAHFKAQGTYTDGSTQDVTNSVAWSSSPAGLVSVKPSGLATGTRIGTATVNAMSGAIAGGSSLTVSPAALTSIAVTFGKAAIPLGTVQQLTATGTYSDGSTQNITSSVAWTSSPGGVIAVNAAGLATGMKLGTASVNAASGAITGTGTLTVSGAPLSSIAVSAASATMPLGTAQQMTAIGTYTDGSTQNLTSAVTWSGSPTGAVTVAPSGTVTGMKVGTATIRAVSGNISGVGSLIISTPVLTSIAVSASKPAMPVGTAQQMIAIGTYTDGSARDLTNSSSWSSSSSKVVSISSSGVAGAIAMGATVISATASAVTGSAPVAVTSAALSAISISPANPTIPLGSSLQFAAIGSFTDGSTQDLTKSASWNVDNPSVVSLNSPGNVTAQQVGTTNVEASFNSVQGTTAIVVEPIAAVTYFANGKNAVDTTFRFTNPGTNGQDLCAMAYVFDQDQQMAECCGCLISQDGLRTLSLNRDLISNPLTGVAPVNGSVMLVTADYPSNPSCNAASITPSGRAIAWATHLQSPNSSVVSEESLSPMPLNPTLSSALQAQCQFIQELGSGQGICSCGTGR